MARERIAMFLFLIGVMLCTMWAVQQGEKALIEYEYKTADPLRKANMLYTGWGIDKPDRGEAFGWYMLASMQGNELAEAALCNYYGMCGK